MPFTYEGTTVRTLLVDGEPWFVLADLTKVLGLSQFRAERLDDEVIRNHPIADRLGRIQQATIVSEPGMYEVVIRSDKPEAVKFRRWITGMVLPEIRRTGSFNARPLTLEQKMAQGLQAANELLAEANQRIGELEPKAEVADRILDAEGDWEVADAAKVLSRAGIKLGRNRLFAELERLEWIYRHRADRKWRIYQTAIDRGYMLPLPKSHYHPKTGDLVLDPPQPRVTAKGVQALLFKLGGGSGQLELEGGVAA
jgi:prophage antirepressor-like protein